MGSDVYHKSVYLPDWIKDKIPKTITQIKYSDHAKYKAKQRNILLPTFVDYPDVIEVTYRNKVKGFVIRVRHNLRQDLCLAFSCSKTKMVCVTCWLNARDDQHPTLDVTRYVNGRQN